MTYSAKDLERARVFLNHYLPDDADVAQLIATVRLEALEEAAVSVERFDEQATNEQFMASRKHMARRIRALKDGAK
jgi:hypothetical protein